MSQQAKAVTIHSLPNTALPGEIDIPLEDKTISLKMLYGKNMVGKQIADLFKESNVLYSKSTIDATTDQPIPLEFFECINKISLTKPKRFYLTKNLGEDNTMTLDPLIPLYTVGYVVFTLYRPQDPFEMVTQGMLPTQVLNLILIYNIDFYKNLGILYDKIDAIAETNKSLTNSYIKKIEHSEHAYRLRTITKRDRIFQMLDNTASEKNA